MQTTRDWSNIVRTIYETGKDPSPTHILDLVTTTADLTVDQGYHSTHTVIDDEGHAKEGEYNAHNNRTKIDSTSDVRSLFGDGSFNRYTKGNTTTVTNNRQENGAYRDELQKDGSYQRTGEGQFTLVDTIKKEGVHGLPYLPDPAPEQGSEWWQFDNGSLVNYTRSDHKYDNTETTTTEGSYDGDTLTQTVTKTETNTTNERQDYHYQYGLNDGTSGWAKDHWRLDNVTTTAPNEETGLIETTARMTEQIYGTKTDANASPPISFLAGPHPNQKFTTLVPFEHTDYTQTVSLVDANGDALLSFDKSVTIDPLNNPPPTRPVVTYEQAGPPDSIVAAFFGGLQYGAVELANSYTQTFTFGYYDLQEAADAAAANNYISDETRRQTRLAANVSSNAAFGAAGAGVVSKGVSLVGKSKAATQIANTRVGQFTGTVASNPITQRVLVGAGHGHNAIDAAKDVTRSATSFAQGDYAGGIAGVFELADNLSFGPKTPNARHMSPTKVTVETPKTVGHHSIPKEIQKKLPEPIRTHPDVRGRRGNPNIKQVDPDKHVKAHDKTGISPKETGIYGGAYNKRFQDEIIEQGGYNKVKPNAITAIRDVLMKEFEL